MRSIFCHNVVGHHFHDRFNCMIFFLWSALDRQVASIGIQLASRMDIETSSSSSDSTGNDTIEKLLTSRDQLSNDKKNDALHAETMFKVAHFFHFCSIGILGMFVIQVVR